MKPSEHWDAVETLERLGRNEVSREAVLEAAIARAEEARHLGGIVTPTFDRARAELDDAASRPLGGLPTFLKDLAEQSGVRTGWGTRACGYHIARRSDAFVRRFEKTGLVSLGKSAAPELGLTGTTEPLAFPPCRNPWDPTRSSGGSSGGAASLVAAGVVPIAHASDGGGSIRIPAACCGLVGLKPTRGRMDMDGSQLLPINIAVNGVVSRSVRDTVAFYEAFEGLNGAGRCERITPVAHEPRRKLRVGVFVDAPEKTPVHPEVQRAVMATGDLCRTLGHEVRDLACPFPVGAIDGFFEYWGLVAWLQVKTARIMMDRRFDASKLEPWTQALATMISRAPRAVIPAIRRLRQLERDYADLMRSHDVLVCPTVAEPAPALGYLATDLDFETCFERLRTYVGFTPIQNVTGAPAISLPLGKSTTGLPIGVQLAAARGDDRTLLELAFSLEAAAPWEQLAPRERWAASPSG